VLPEIDVLVVEDHAILRDQLVASLAKKGWNVRAAANGRVALKTMESCKPRVMVTDIFMPEIEGLELIRLTRGLSSEIKIIAMSGGSVVCGNFLHEAGRFGANAVLQKPFSRSELSELVSSLLDGPDEPSPPSSTDNHPAI
jgi:CheY-like chemotaxis protein